MAGAFKIESLKSKVSESEWNTRVNLAAIYRLIALYGWDDLIYTHNTARLPDEKDHFLINPYGMLFDEITASSRECVRARTRSSPAAHSPARFRSCWHRSRSASRGRGDL